MLEARERWEPATDTLPTDRFRGLGVSTGANVAWECARLVPGSSSLWRLAGEGPEVVDRKVDEALAGVRADVLFLLERVFIGTGAPQPCGLAWEESAADMTQEKERAIV